MSQLILSTKQVQPILAELPPGWITKPEAIRLLNRNVKTFEQIVRQHGIKSQLLENPGKRATPIYQRTDIERLVRPAGPTALVTQPTGPIQPIHPPIQPPKPIQPTRRLPALASAMPVSELHLITAKQAHELGYPYELLREMKRRPNPPGIRYGKAGFRFSVPALRREVSLIGLDGNPSQSNPLA